MKKMKFQCLNWWANRWDLSYLCTIKSLFSFGVSGATVFQGYTQVSKYDCVKLFKMLWGLRPGLQLPMQSLPLLQDHICQPQASGKFWASVNVWASAWPSGMMVMPSCIFWQEEKRNVRIKRISLIFSVLYCFKILTSLQVYKELVCVCVCVTFIFNFIFVCGYKLFKVWDYVMICL